MEMINQIVLLHFPAHLQQETKDIHLREGITLDTPIHIQGLQSGNYIYLEDKYSSPFIISEDGKPCSCFHKDFIKQVLMEKPYAS